MRPRATAAPRIAALASSVVAASGLRLWSRGFHYRQLGVVTWRAEWTEIGLTLGISILAIAPTAWQVHVDRSMFERFFGALDPIVVMIGTVAVGVAAIVYLQSSGFAVLGPGEASNALLGIAVGVPLFAAAAIVADLVIRYPEDTHVAMPDALRFYPAIAVFVEIALHAVPIAILVAAFGAPTGLDATFWRVAIPVALIEAVLQAGYAASVGTAVFSAVHVAIFGLAQVWMFWRFGFVWMLGFRLAYYSLWHVVWGVIRLELLF